LALLGWSLGNTTSILAVYSARMRRLASLLADCVGCRPRGRL